MRILFFFFYDYDLKDTERSQQRSPVSEKIQSAGSLSRQDLHVHDQLVGNFPQDAQRQFPADHPAANVNHFSLQLWKL